MSLSIKNGIQLSSLNMVNNVPVVLMRTALFCIHKTYSSNSLLHDYQIGPGLSESFEVDSCVVKVSSLSRDILCKKHHL